MNGSQWNVCMSACGFVGENIFPGWFVSKYRVCFVSLSPSNCNTHSFKDFVLIERIHLINSRLNDCRI